LKYWVFSSTADNFRIAFENNIWAVDSVSKKNLVSHGDRVIFYVKGTGEFRGGVEVVGQWEKATSPIWKEELDDNQIYWPWQTTIRWLAAGRVRAKSAAQELSFIGNKNTWYVYLMGTPANFRREIPEADYNLIVNQMQPVDSQPLQVETLPIERKGAGGALVFESGTPDLSHTEIQYTLIKLGKYGGCEVWVPRGDRNRSFNDETFASLTLDSLPQLGFGDKARRIVENIDVLWFRQNVILAAFEVEHTTSIYSGLLRMSDLIAVQPNTRFPLFIVVPEERREKAWEEITRPTFENLGSPLSKACKVWTYDDLTKVHEEVSKSRFPPTWSYDNVARLGDNIHGARVFRESLRESSQGKWKLESQRSSKAIWR
jgi:predicted RNA-binding protein